MAAGLQIQRSGGNSYTTYFRQLDVRIGRWLSIDPKPDAWQSHYTSMDNNPIVYNDPLGDDIHFLIYTDDGTGMFEAAAVTRAEDIKKHGAFDSKKDIVIMIKVGDVSDIKKQIEDNIKIYSNTYGKTVEVGIWSHASKDGPIGSDIATEYNLFNETEKDGDEHQMTMEGWEDIDYNWIEDGRATMSFYGCNTANDDKNFCRSVSNLKNYNRVTVRGQPTSAYPSTVVDERLITENIESEIHKGYRRYLVASSSSWNDDLGGIFNDATPLKTYKNGFEKGEEFQDGYNCEGYYTSSSSFLNLLRKVAVRMSEK